MELAENYKKDIWLDSVHDEDLIGGPDNNNNLKLEQG